MDAVDLVLADINDNKIQTLDYQQSPFPAELKQSLEEAASDFSTPIKDVMELDRKLGLHLGKSIKHFINDSLIDAENIIAIGCHGQTLLHHPNGEPAYTLQIGDPNTIAYITGITTIADFRRMDIAAGGQGAPLVPAFHKAVFGNDLEKRVIVNIGGISNITILNASDVSGFDTGPGNCLMDEWIQQHKQLSYDHNGEWAGTGQIHSPLLETMLEDPYFELPPPKSTGREYFNLDWLMSVLKPFNASAEDIQATLLEFTVTHIISAISRYASTSRQVLVCGGGAHNKLLLRRITAALPTQQLQKTDDYGMPVDQVEAAAFAWLAKCRMEQQSLDLHAITGAEKKIMLGTIFQA